MFDRDIEKLTIVFRPEVGPDFSYNVGCQSRKCIPALVRKYLNEIGIHQRSSHDANKNNTDVGKFDWDH